MDADSCNRDAMDIPIRFSGKSGTAGAPVCPCPYGLKRY